MKRKKNESVDTKNEECARMMSDENCNDIMGLFKGLNFHDAIMKACDVLEVFTSADNDRAFTYMLKKLYNFFLTPIPGKSLIFDYKIKLFMLFRLIHSDYDKTKRVINGSLSFPWCEWFIQKNAGLKDNFEYKLCLKNLIGTKETYRGGFTWRPSDDEIKELENSMKGVRIKDTFYKDYHAEFNDFKKWLVENSKLPSGSIHDSLYESFGFEEFDNVKEHLEICSKYAEWKMMKVAKEIEGKMV